MGLVAVALLVLLAVGVQAAGRLGLGRRVPVGDEIEYLERAGAPDPFGPTPFLRVPLVALIASAVGPKRTETRLRNVFAGVSLATAACVGIAGHLAAGTPGALAATLLFVLLPERIVLSQHLWPDVVLGLWQGILALMIVHSVCVAPLPAWAFGAVGAAAVMTRIDAVILLPALALVWAGLGQPLAPALAALWLPAAASLAAWTIRSWRRYAIVLPDDTFLFNIMVLDEEHRQSRSADVPVETLVGSVWPRWTEGHGARTSRAFRGTATALARHPLRLLRGGLERTWQMLGADTFVTERLLHRDAGAYPEISEPLRAAIARGVRAGFPILVGLAVGGAVVDPLARLCILPGAAAFLAAALVQGRTRYRHGVLPPLCVAAAIGLLAAATRWDAAVVATCIAAALLCAPRRREREPSMADAGP